MFYIEKNDKPNFLQRNLSLIKIRENTIILPISENTKEKQIERLAKRTEKIIGKQSNSKKIVLSKQLQQNTTYINYLNMYGIDIQDGKWLFEILLTDITDYIINKKEIQKVNISILINELTEIELYNIKTLARKYKTINIVTNHIEKFKKLEEQLQEDEGIIITITNNRRKSLMKSQIVINVDFPKELLNKYNINDDSIIINVRGKVKINKKRFNGLNIYDYDIDFRDDKKDIVSFTNNYFLKDIYEGKFYKKQRVRDIRDKLKVDGVVVKKLILNNGEL